MAQVYSLLITYLLTWQTLNSKIFYFWQGNTRKIKTEKGVKTLLAIFN